MYLYLHDQTLRLINQGYVGSEIAEVLEMPPALDAAWHTHGYYGSVSHNVKAIYQRYLGWYEGATRLALAILREPRALRRRHGWPTPSPWPGRPTTTATTAGPSRSSTTSCSPTTRTPRLALQADAMEQLAFGAENGTWRNAYLAGAAELRHGSFGTPTTVGPTSGALTVTQVFDSVAIRIDGPRAWDEHLTLSWVISDAGATYVTELRNGALNHREVDAPASGHVRHAHPGTSSGSSPAPSTRPRRRTARSPSPGILRPPAPLVADRTRRPRLRHRHPDGHRRHRPDPACSLPLPSSCCWPPPAATTTIRLRGLAASDDASRGTPWRGPPGCCRPTPRWAWRWRRSR